MYLCSGNEYVDITGAGHCGPPQDILVSFVLALRSGSESNPKYPGAPRN